MTSAWRARSVTLALVAALLVAGGCEAELWPVSSFRLYSDARDGETWATRLTVISPDGREAPVRLSGVSGLRAARQQLLATIRHPPDRQRRELRRWLEVAGLDPSHYRAVRIYRVLLRTPTGAGPREVVRRIARVEVAL